MEEDKVERGRGSLFHPLFYRAQLSWTKPVRVPPLPPSSWRDDPRSLLGARTQAQ